MRLEKPILEVAEDAGIQRNSLRHYSPTYLPYSSLQRQPTILDEAYANTTGLFQRITATSNDIYLIDEKNHWYNKTHQVYTTALRKLDFESGHLGDVATQSDDDLLKYIRKTNDAIGFIYDDPLRWLQYAHLDNRIVFELLEMNETTKQLNSKGTAALTLGDSWVVMRSIYYQQTDGTEESWMGTLVETDSEDTLHLRSIQFDYSPHTKFTVQPLIQTETSLKNMLGCPDPARMKKQLKGFFYRRENKQLIVYLFVDTYYMRLETDPTKSRLKVITETAEDAMRRTVKFDMPMAIERLAALKYVKVLGKKAYLTFDNQATFTTKFEGKGASERLVPGEQQEVQAHLCPYQTLAFGRHVFCFQKQFYYLISKDGMQTEFVGRQRPIAEIFEGSRMTYDKEDLELIITDRPSFNQAAKPKHDIIFVFTSWLLKFDSYLFMLAEDPIYPGDFLIDLRLRQVIPLFMFERRRNCFWLDCSEYCKFFFKILFEILFKIHFEIRLWICHFGIQSLDILL